MHCPTCDATERDQILAAPAPGAEAAVYRCAECGRLHIVRPEVLNPRPKPARSTGWTEQIVAYA